MTGLLFADTNLLIYGVDPSDPGKRDIAVVLLRKAAAAGRLVTSPQSLNECYRVICQRRKLMPAAEARAFVASWFVTCDAEVTRESIRLAWDIEDGTGYSWWDCLLLSSAILAGCTHFLTEDLSDGHAIHGMTIVNPFTNDVASLLT
jgi:predicted nucleic acid-binding protein